MSMGEAAVGNVCETGLTVVFDGVTLHTTTGITTSMTLSAKLARLLRFIALAVVSTI